jgi:hypothetical protein
MRVGPVGDELPAPGSGRKPIRIHLDLGRKGFIMTQGFAAPRLVRRSESATHPSAGNALI